MKLFNNKYIKFILKSFCKSLPKVELCKINYKLHKILVFKNIYLYNYNKLIIL